jgi:2-iminobutanoate/2-iminopropanoate deaminase
MTVRFDNPPGAPAPFADRYSNVAAIDLGHTTLLVLSGQVALDEHGAIAGPDMTTQADVIFQGIGAMLAAHGGSFDDVVNIRTFLTDLGLLAEYGAVRRKYLTGTPPTSTTIEISRLFLPEALLEVEVTAVVAK